MQIIFPFLSPLQQKKATFSSPPRLSSSFGNKSFLPNIHGWVNPDKNATVHALGRSIGLIANSSNPLNATKAAASGLELHKRETKALILGQSGLVTYASSFYASPTAVPDLKCFVDPMTGQLVGLEQAGGPTFCSKAASFVVVPTSTAGYISQVKLAYTYDGAFVGRLIFELKANATAVSICNGWREIEERGSGERKERWGAEQRMSAPPSAIFFFFFFLLALLLLSRESDLFSCVLPASFRSQQASAFRLSNKTTPTIQKKPTTYTCGSAGGKAVSLLPNDNGYVITKLGVGCAPLSASDAGRRKLKAAPGLGLSAG